MLANITPTSIQSGLLAREVFLPSSALYTLLDFIKDELPRWRDRNDRPKITAENSLTSQLCDHLNSAARHAKGWDILQFRTEAPDELSNSRTIDLVPKPCDATITIAGRCYCDFDTLLPIECKRLPTPKANDRDEYEYVINRNGTTGGIQRFKEGHHGAAHKLGAMIAYIQRKTRAFWNSQISDWINQLVQDGYRGWTKHDLLKLLHEDDNLKMSVLHSSHERNKGQAEIELRHLWIEMN
jgi:hypothetical protein